MNKKHTGFTLMEATVALAFLTVGMLGLTAAFSQIVNSNTVTRQKRLAAFLATTKMAELRALPLTEITELNGTFGQPFQDYSWQVQLDYQFDNDKVSNVALQVSHKSGINVRLWTRMEFNDAQQ